MSTNPNSPLEPPSATTTARTSIYGNPVLSSSSVSLELANGEVVELEKFAAKKIWIDDKIEFLSSLSPIDAFEPLPPARSVVSAKELETWWREHDAIETEVHEFDYGDMAKMKALAMEASKHNLSREETNLIEVTLNNLFAVDKLLHLLRSRRKKLNLVDLRLKWEAQLAECAIAHRDIANSLPAFISQARWCLPTTPDPSTFSSPTSSATDPSAPSPTADSLPSALATVHSHLARLSTTLIPASATTLDQLMDTARLPDAFLDEQDRVEEAAKQLSATLPRFLAGMVEQRKAADKVHRRAVEGVERPAQALQAEVDAALGEMPDAARSAAFAASLAQLEATLNKASARLCRPESGMVVLPLPLHPLVPDQVVENARLLQVLTKTVARATSALDGARERVGRYEQACRAKAAADELLGEVERCSASLKELVAELGKLGGQPDLASAACLDLTEEEKSYDAGVDRIRRQAEGLLAGVPGLTGRVPEAAVALDQAGVPVQTKRALKEAASQLDASSSTFNTLLHQHQRRHDHLAALRAAAADVDGSAHQLDIAEASLRRQLDAARWREGQGEVVELDGAEVDVDSLRSSWQAAEADTLRAAEAASAGAVSAAMDLIRARGADVRARLDALAQHDALLRHTRAQRTSTAAVLDEAHGPSADVGKQQTRVDDTLSLPLDSDNLEARQAALAELTQRAAEAAAKLEELKGGVHGRIPFLAGRDAPGVSWNLAEQDASVRAAVNEATAAVGGQFDALRQSLSRLSEQISRPPTPPPAPPRAATPAATPVVAKAPLSNATLSPASAEAQLEQADHVEPLGLSLHRSHAHRRLPFDHLPAKDDVFGSSPAPPLARTASQDDRAARLRAEAERLEGVEVDDWLDEEFLELPAEEEAGQIERELDGVEAELDRIEEGASEGSLQADVGEVREELRRKRGVSAQVHELAAFRAEVEEADGSLSDLLNAIDAASPDLAAHPDHSSDAGSRSPLPPMPLADALAASRYSVEAAKTAAVLLLDDSRVRSEVDRLEQALEEMVAMADEVEEQEERSGRGSPLSVRSRVSSRTSSLSHSASRPELVGRRASGRSASSSSAHSIQSAQSLGSSSSRMSIGGEGGLPRPRLSGSQSSASLASLGQSLSRSGSVSHLPGLSRSSSSASLSRLPKSATFVGGASLARTASNTSAASAALTSSTHSRSSRRSLSQSTSALMATPLARRFASASTASSVDLGKDTTPRRRSKASSGIPVATPRAPSRSTATPTIAQPFSFSTAQPRRALAQRSPNTPRVRKTSGSLSTPTAEDKRRLREKLETTPSRYMDSVRRSSATASEQRRRRSGSLSSPRAGKKPYKANPKRKVDVELGKVVNALPIAVEVRAAENEWHDQHGSYWIGGRLYFCRILRSKTCMVRVGGGWTRLETFLVSKFGKADGVTISPSLDRTKPPPLSASANGLDRSLRRSSSGVGQAGESLWISSRDLRADLSASTSSALSPRQRDHFELGAASSFLAASVGASNGASGGNGGRARRISSSASTGGFSLLGASVGRSGGEAMRRSSSSLSGGWVNDGGLSEGVGKGGPSGMRWGGSVGWGIGLGLPGMGVGEGAERRRKSSGGRRVSSLMGDGGLSAGAGGRVASPGGERVQAPWRI